MTQSRGGLSRGLSELWLGSPESIEVLIEGRVALLR
jgi:hypothetical protein